MNKRKNILITTSWSFNDALIQTYTLPYVKIIQKYLPKESKIYLFTLRQESYYRNFDKNESQKIELEKNNIIVIEKPFNKFGIKSILSTFFSLFKLFFLIHLKKINTIHSWCTPAGSLGYILSILTGRDLIIDSFEPHAEAMVENGEWKKGSFAFKILFKLEKLQTKQAKYLISATEGMKDYSRNKYNHTTDNFFVKPACINLDEFKKEINPELREKLNIGREEIVCVYAGKFGGIYLEQEVFDFWKTAYKYWNKKFKVIILSSTSAEEIMHMAAKSFLPKECLIIQFVQHKDVAKYLSLADFAITPVKPVPSKRYCTPIKNGEYWALGLPVVIPNNISDDSEIIKQNNIGSILNSFTEESYVNSIEEINTLLKGNKKVLQSNIQFIANKYRSFDIAEDVYQKIYS